MQSTWDDFVAQRTVIKQMVSPTSTAECGLYMSWRETGYATQGSTLHWVAVPTHLLHDLVWRVCLASQSALSHSPQSTLCSQGSLHHRGLAGAIGGTEHWGTGHKGSPGGVFSALVCGEGFILLRV